ncbi:uncharacterized protein LOC143070518 [Mytilus galloprovincialis]|uniref:uncharacterized protein LOC143070518 n=1 Tax=Mytilus galloprovincialis TaxID=29158 RepID=UPI003F7C5A4C
MEKMSNISGAKDKESLMMVKLRRLFLQEPDKMKELKLLLRHHLPSEILQPEKEFPDIFDALTFQSKIELGEYSFLCDIFSEICFEAEKITREYQAIIINLLGHHISEQKRNSLVDKEQNLDSLDKKQKRDSLVDKREVVGAMSSKKVNCSEIVGDVANKYIYELDKELDEELECRQNIKKMAQVAVQEEKNMKAKQQ